MGFGIAVGTFVGAALLLSLWARHEAGGHAWMFVIAFAAIVGVGASVVSIIRSRADANPGGLASRIADRLDDD